MNFSIICRCCLKELSQEDLEISNYFTMDMFLFCVQLSDEDGLPKNFCWHCCHQIKLTYEFIKQAQSCSKKLQHMVFQHKEVKQYLDLDNDNGNMENKSDLMVKHSDLSDISSFECVKESKLIIDHYFNVEETLTSQLNNEQKGDPTETNKKQVMLKKVPCEVKGKVEGYKKIKLKTLQSSDSEDFQNTDVFDEEITPRSHENMTCLETEMNEFETVNNVYNETMKNCENNHTIPETPKEVTDKNITRCDLSEAGEPNKVDRKFACNDCNKSYFNQRFLEKHINRKHYKASSDEPNSQGYTNNNFEAKLFACNTCGKQFRQRKGLSVHAITHSNQRPFICNFCHMSFKMKQVLLKHLRIHEDYCPFLCHVCAKGFKNQHNLQEHMATHTGERSFACRSCGYRAAHRSSLRRHEARHSAARDHVCSQCHKAFKQRPALKRHIRIHTGEKPFRCPHCPLAFIDHWKRKTHLMRVHQLPFGEIPRLAADGNPINKW